MISVELFFVSFKEAKKWRYSPLKPDKGNNKRNTFGLITLVLWALLLTLLFRSCSSSYASSNQVEVGYSTFKAWVAADLVDAVEMQSSQYTIILKDGAEEQARTYLPEDEAQSGTSSLFSWVQGPGAEVEYVTTPPSTADLGIFDFLDEHGVDYAEVPIDSSSQILYLIITTFLPILLMVGAMVFLFRGIGGKGGMGGIGGVGKANAKVYVEKKTGVLPGRGRPGRGQGVSPGDH